MPLASNNRLSLPATIDSSTRATRSKALKRRASLRNKREPSPARHPQNKENAPPSPGPTPYWKVAKERGGVPSPPETRSAKKKKRALLAKFAVGSSNQGPNGLLLTFSPPDQEANRRREADELARKEANRAKRIEGAKRRGQLLVFDKDGESKMDASVIADDVSTGGSYSSSNSEKDVIQRVTNVPNRTRKEKKHVSKVVEVSSGGHNEKELINRVVEAVSDAQQKDSVASELKNMRETLSQLVKSNSSKERMETNVLKAEAEKMALEAQLMRCQQMEADKSKLEEANHKLQDEMKALDSVFTETKELHLVEKTKLEAELESCKREQSTKVRILEETKEKLERQLSVSKSERNSLSEQAAVLERDLVEAKAKLGEARATLKALRTESNSEMKTVSAETRRLKLLQGELESELGTAILQRNEFEAKVLEYEEALESLESNLTTTETTLKQTMAELEERKIEAARATKQLAEASHRIKEMTAEMKTLKSEKDDERLQFQKLNESTNLAFQKMSADALEKDRMISELSEKLELMEGELASEQKRHNKAVKQMHDLTADVKKNERDFRASMSELTDRLSQSERSRSDLVERLESERERAVLLLAEKKRSVDDCSEMEVTVEKLRRDLGKQGKSVERLENEREAYKLRVRELEEMLHMTEAERNDARTRMATFDSREEELFRRLREGDRIRRDLHNKVMQLSGNIRVYVRVRPCLAGESEQSSKSQSKKAQGRKRKHDAIRDEDSPFSFPVALEESASSAPSDKTDLTKNLIVMKEPYKDRGGLSDRRKKWRFGFDRVFSPSQGQDDVWEATEPLVQSAIDGFNVCIFAYGQTGSGKTYTMLGEPSNEGLVSRATRKLFAAKEEIETLSKGSNKVKLAVELLEIYNEQVRDLLEPASGPGGSDVNLKVTPGEVVGNLLAVTSNENEVLDVLDFAQSRRCVKATNSNAESSRSHMLFTIHFMLENDNSGVSRKGKLHICDLAGSERLDKSGAHVMGDDSLLRETKSINLSLSVLSNVIERLQAGSPNVPFRESKLTTILQNSLGGNSKTLAIVCCNPLTSHFHESLCSLRFAEKVNKVDLKAVANFTC